MNIALTSNAAQIVRQLQGMPRRMLEGVAAALDVQNQNTVGHIQTTRLSGKGPFDPSQHRLGERTSKLRQSLRRSGATISGNAVDSTIGTNKEYAAIHEFGGTIHRKAHSGTVRLAVEKDGSLVRQRHGGAMFADRKRSRVRLVAYHAEAYDVKMPARSPIAAGIQDKAPDYTRRISGAIETAWNSPA